MPEPAAKELDRIVATDIHLANKSRVDVPFDGKLKGELSSNVFVERKHAAVVGSSATNEPPHVPPPGKTFDTPPTNKGVISTGSATVFINNKRAARNGDKAKTCNDGVDPERGTVVAAGQVLIGR